MKVRLTKDYIILAGTVVEAEGVCGNNTGATSVKFSCTCYTSNFKQVPTKEQYEAAKKVIDEYEATNPQIDNTCSLRYSGAEIAKAIAESMQRYNYSKGAR